MRILVLGCLVILDKLKESELNLIFLTLQENQKDKQLKSVRLRSVSPIQSHQNCQTVAPTKSIASPETVPSP